MRKRRRSAQGDTIKEHIASRIQSAREQAGLSQDELGNMLGKSNISISAYERAVRSPDIPKLEKIAIILGKPLSWFFERESPALSKPPPAPSGSLPTIIANLQEWAKTYIPVYDSIPGAKTYSVPVDFVSLTTKGLDLKHVRGYRIVGLACEPGIKDGDTLIVDSAAAPVSGDYVLVKSGGKPEIGIYAVGKDGKAVIADSANSWGLESCRVVGVVVELHRTTL